MRGPRKHTLKLPELELSRLPLADLLALNTALMAIKVSETSPLDQWIGEALEQVMRAARNRPQSEVAALLHAAWKAWTEDGSKPAGAAIHKSNLFNLAGVYLNA